MHIKHRVVVVFGHVLKGLVAQVARVVDKDIERAEGLHCVGDDALRAVARRNRRFVGNCLAALCPDLGNHIVRSVTTTGAIDAAAQIIHHNLCAPCCECQRMSAAQTSARTSNNHDLAFKLTHRSIPSIPT